MTDLLLYAALSVVAIGSLLWALDQGQKEIYRRSDIQRRTGVRPKGAPPWVWMLVPMVVGTFLIFASYL